MPQAALAAGLPSRYLYWRGWSGRRYLFTRTDLAALADFDEAVVILVEDGDIVFSGGAADARAAARSLGRVSVHVHLLAMTDRGRRAVAADLAPHEVCVLRLAA